MDLKYYQEKIKNQVLEPNEAAQLLRELAAQKGELRDIARNADIEYNKFLYACLKGSDKASHAKILAESSDEYRKKREAQDDILLADDLGASLKYTLRVSENELISYQNKYIK